MKKIIVTFILLIAGVSPAHADSTPVIALIDAGVNTSLFKDSIVAEYCVLEFALCPNGKPTMEGTGAANLPANASPQFDHGAQMMSVILKVNPSAKVIPIRIVGMTKNGLPTLYTNQAVKLGLDWVLANAEKYNIKVVNVSQGAIIGNCYVPPGTAETIAALKVKGVTVVSATGNNGNRTAMNSIACLSGVVSVGATDNPDPGVAKKAWNPNAVPYIARYSNGNSQTTYYTNGRFYSITNAGVTKFTVGTSNASAAIAALLLTTQNPVTTEVSNEWLKGRYVFIP